MDKYRFQITYWDKSNRKWKKCCLQESTSNDYQYMLKMLIRKENKINSLYAYATNRIIDTKTGTILYQTSPCKGCELCSR